MIWGLGVHHGRVVFSCASWVHVHVCSNTLNAELDLYQLEGTWWR